MTALPLFDVGFARFVMTDRAVALVSNETPPMRRVIRHGRGSGGHVDATQARRSKPVGFTTDSIIVLSAVRQETLAKRPTSEEIATDG